MTKLERSIIRELQKDMPLHLAPYAVLADKLGITEQELLRHLHRLRHVGIIRKISAVLRHRQFGFQANALCVWEVPINRVVAVGTQFAALDFVTHCYERQSYSDWPYNLYTMIHAKNREECLSLQKAMSAMSGIENYQAFFSSQELKKTSMQYY